MVYFEKSYPEPASLVTEKLKKTGSYGLEDVLTKLKEDFYNKCYVCEYKEPTTINVEHFRPHKGNIDLKFNWANLFWVCAHCNNIKGDDYVDIIDCTNQSEGIGNRLKFQFNPMPFESVTITKLDDQVATISTQKLLDAAYNGSTPLKKIESANLRNQLLKEILEFNSMLCNFYLYSNNQDERDYFHLRIVGHLNRASNFTAFKRTIIVSNVQMRADFEHLFN